MKFLLFCFSLFIIIVLLGTGRADADEWEPVTLEPVQETQQLQEEQEAAVEAYEQAEREGNTVNTQVDSEQEQGTAFETEGPSVAGSPSPAPGMAATPAVGVPAGIRRANRPLHSARHASRCRHHSRRHSEGRGRCAKVRKAQRARNPHQ